MSDEYWDGGNPVESGDQVLSDRTSIVVNGSRIFLEPGVPFKDTVRSYAKDSGMGKFRVFYNNEEIKPDMAPDLVSEGDNIELRPYDVAGK